MIERTDSQGLILHCNCMKYFGRLCYPWPLTTKLRRWKVGIYLCTESGMYSMYLPRYGGMETGVHNDAEGYTFLSKECLPSDLPTYLCMHLLGLQDLLLYSTYSALLALCRCT